MTDRAYKLTLVPERTNVEHEYVIVRDIEDFEEAGTELDDDFFMEVIDDRYPGYVIDGIDAVSVEYAEAHDPFDVS